MSLDAAPSADPAVSGEHERPTPLAPADASTAGERARRRWRRWRWAAAVVALVLLFVLVTALSIPRGTVGRLDPGSPEPDGARAVAQILRGQGVDVRRVTRSDQVATAGVASTVVVVDTDLLGPRQLERLSATADTGATLVLVEPDAVVLAALAPGIVPTGVVPARSGEPICRDAAALAAGEARAGGHLYRSSAPGAAVCYPDADDDTSGSYVALTADGRRLVVLGQGELLMNEHLAQDGNAALALRTLGTRPDVVWYVPDPLELSTAEDPATLSELVPDRVWWVAVQLVVVVLLALFWRARRLGPLVAEPLPVVVRSAETQEGRARLYRQARARGRAAATLRTAALRRLARRLDVGHDATPDQVATLAAAAAGLPPARVQRTLLGPAPAHDGDLVRLADELDRLENALRPQSTTTTTTTRKAARP